MNLLTPQATATSVCWTLPNVKVAKMHLLFLISIFHFLLHQYHTVFISSLLKGISQPQKKNNKSEDEEIHEDVDNCLTGIKY